MDSSAGVNGSLPPEPEGSKLSTSLPIWGVAGVLLILVAVRVVALGADPPPWLSWSGGLYTDEGFYTLDARHAALWGTWARGDFHDRLLSPPLSALQQGVFYAFGAGLVQARSISVVFGLLTLGVFGWGMRAAGGPRAALWTVGLLGLAPPFVLYNRLALQETPAAFWLCLAFALWARGGRAPSGTAMTLAGAAAGLALTIKGLAIIALPALLWGGVQKGRIGRSVWVGLALVLAAYGLLWYLPHHAELARMGRYYGRHQFTPHSLRSVWLNVRRGLLGDRMGIMRGVVPYLLVMMPVPCLLAALGARSRALPERVLTLWLAGGLAFCLLLSYAPDRYYVLFLPPLAGLAGCALASMSVKRQWAWGSAFAITSALWLGTAWQGRTYTERDTATALAKQLPPGSVVIGDVAPALCLGTGLDAAPVQPGLSNTVRPVETLGADYAAIMRAPVYTHWWTARYPQLVQPARRVAALRVGNKRIVDVYRVKP